MAFVEGTRLFDDEAYRPVGLRVVAETPSTQLLAMPMIRGKWPVVKSINYHMHRQSQGQKLCMLLVLAKLGGTPG